MNEEKRNDLINRYFDNELSKEEEIFLFTYLSEDEEGREYFKALASVNEAVKNTREDFPENLDEKIFEKLPVDGNGISRGRSFVSPPALFAYAVSVVMLIFLLIFKTDLEQNKREIQAQASIINRQNKMIELLFNSLPAATVSAERKQQIIVTPNS